MFLGLTPLRVNPTLLNSRAIAFQQCGQCRWAVGMKGRLIRAQTTRSKRISCRGRQRTAPVWPFLRAAAAPPPIARRVARGEEQVWQGCARQRLKKRIKGLGVRRARQSYISIYLSINQSIYQSIYLSIYIALSIYIYMYIIYLHICGMD